MMDHFWNRKQNPSSNQNPTAKTMVFNIISQGNVMSFGFKALEACTFISEHVTFALLSESEEMIKISNMLKISDADAYNNKENEIRTALVNVVEDAVKNGVADKGLLAKSDSAKKIGLFSKAAVDDLIGKELLQLLALEKLEGFAAKIYSTSEEKEAGYLIDFEQVLRDNIKENTGMIITKNGHTASVVNLSGRIIYTDTKAFVAKTTIFADINSFIDYTKNENGFKNAPQIDLTFVKHKEPELQSGDALAESEDEQERKLDTPQV
ncbi:MAG: hypothetical protein KKE11_03485 [Gammaproteobacteria bacterium]|nr:hypothetical protein [Gammaproteobacteria bacterium]